MCYKLIVDIENANAFSDFYQHIIKVGDVIYSDGVFYIWCGNSKRDRNDIRAILKKCDIDSYILKDIKKEDCVNEMSFVNVWITDKFTTYETEQIEIAHQKELNNMLNNIQMFTDMLDDYQKNNMKK